MTTELALGDLIQTRKKHPCGSDRWQVIRIGADIKIKCLDCGRVVMMERPEFIKRRKKILEQGPVPEAETLRQMDIFAAEQGYVPDFTAGRLHHEIYLGDPRRTAPEKLKTVLRHPVRKK